MESFQKRDRDRKKLERRTVKEKERKERAERRKNGIPEPKSTHSDEILPSTRETIVD